MDVFDLVDLSGPSDDVGEDFEMTNEENPEVIEMKNHPKRKKPKKTLDCYSCGKSFTKINNLILHKNSVHEQY